MSMLLRRSDEEEPVFFELGYPLSLFI